MLNNPFVPGFGRSPRFLAGRMDVISAVTSGLDVQGSRHYASLIVGQKGTGKTVVLNEIERAMVNRDWHVIAITATPATGFVTELHEKTRRLVLSLVPKESKPKVSSISFTLPVIGGGAGIEWKVEPDELPSLNLRDLLTGVGIALAGEESGLLITIDEMHSAPLDEVREFGAAIQHVTMRESHPVAFVAAALPVLEDMISASSAATFLQRCSRSHLEHIAAEEVAKALRSTIEDAGRKVTSHAVNYAANATSGYAYMIQLVGYEMWETGASEIKLEHAKRGVAEATRLLGEQVLLPQWNSASREDKLFLTAMTLDASNSKVASIRLRLKRDANHVNSYRDRLIKAGWVQPAGHGLVRFAQDGALDWIKEQDGYEETLSVLTRQE